MPPKRKQLGLHDYKRGLLEGDRATLARAITLMESQRAQDQSVASALIGEILPHTGEALRIGLTGVPGVGKSTLIDTLGMQLLETGHRVAVLAVDPSSARSGGSILGDKTRMERLASDPRAYIRPSPTSGTLGGVASKTREAMLCCEAAGYDVILVETVGVGQSEIMVAQMTDVFVALMLSGAGDELQGIKRGLMELADILAINKADGGQEPRANKAAQGYRNALHYLHPKDALWHPPVLTCSGQKGTGLETLWTTILDHRKTLIDNQALNRKRQEQQLSWFWSRFDDAVRVHVRQSPRTRDHITTLESAIMAGTMAPTRAAEELLQRLLQD